MAQIKNMVFVGSAAAVGSMAANGAAAQDFDGSYGGVVLSYSQGPVFDDLNLTGSYDLEGGSIGVFGGYNWSSGPWIYGVDLSLSTGDNIEAGDDYQSFYGPMSLQFLADVRGRAGRVIGNTFVYGALGWSFAETNYEGGYNESAEGYNVGIGFEHDLGAIGSIGSGPGGMFIGGDITYRDMGENDYLGAWKLSTASVRIGMRF